MQCAGEPFGAESLGPFVEWQIAGDEHLDGTQQINSRGVVIAGKWWHPR